MLADAKVAVSYTTAALHRSGVWICRQFLATLRSETYWAESGEHMNYLVTFQFNVAAPGVIEPAVPLQTLKFALPEVG